MKMSALCIVLILALTTEQAWSAALGDSDKNGSQAELHFGFETENGQQRSEDIMYKIDDHKTEVKPVEYKGGYSFVSADGYEYTVLYKANKNGFQPYVTAHKLKRDEDRALATR